MMNTNPNDRVPDLRAQAHRRRVEAEQRRSEALLEQRSLEHTPEMRVRLWESLHQLRMPKDPAHAILAQIAHDTRLQLADVQEVQRMRASP